MAQKNHKTGQPWKTQFPRLKDGGWKDGNDIRFQLHKAKGAVDQAEFFSIPGYEPEEIHDRIMHAMSLLQEASDMLADRYRIDRDQAKAAFIKVNADSFINPAPFLEECDDE